MPLKIFLHFPCSLSGCVFLVCFCLNSVNTEEKEHLNLNRQSCGRALKQDFITYELAVRDVYCILNSTCRASDWSPPWQGLYKHVIKEDSPFPTEGSAESLSLFTFLCPLHLLQLVFLFPVDFPLFSGSLWKGNDPFRQLCSTSCSISSASVCSQNVLFRCHHGRPQLE